MSGAGSASEAKRKPKPPQTRAAQSSTSSKPSATIASRSGVAIWSTVRSLSGICQTRRRSAPSAARVGSLRLGKNQPRALRQRRGEGHGGPGGERRQQGESGGARHRSCA